MSHDRDQRALDDLFWRTEILQAMYWMRGEGLATEVEAGELARFLVADPALVEEQLRRLEAGGYVACTPVETIDLQRRYTLLPPGIEEGGRSFHDEFADMISRGHGECGPGCWCRDPRRAGEPCPGALETARAHGEG